MKVAAIQRDILWEDAAATLALVTPLVASAAADGALIVLTEMFATGFSMHPERIVEDEGGPSEQYLAAQAVKHDAYFSRASRWA